MCAKQKWPKNEKWTKTKRKMGCGKIPGEMTTKSKKKCSANDACSIYLSPIETTSMDSLALLKISKYLLFGMSEMTVVNWMLQAIIEFFPIQFPYCLVWLIDFK